MMNSPTAKLARSAFSPWMLVALVISIPLMKPAVAYPIIIGDIVFLGLAAAIAVDGLLGRIAVEWDKALWPLPAYVAALAPSLLASGDWFASVFKLAMTGYLAALAFATSLAARDAAIVRQAILAWLAATAALITLTGLSLIAYSIGPDTAIYSYSRSHFGSLPPGHYPRLSLSFFNANMACNYLTVSLGLLTIAFREKWLGGTLSLFLLIGIVAAGLSTLSPGLGGIALAMGVGGYLLWRSRGLLAAGATVAGLALFAACLSPTTAFEPSARVYIWSAAASEFIAHPVLGHGIGIEAVSVDFLNPGGFLQHVTDAHNVFLSIAVQAGLFGLAGLTLLIAYVIQLSRANSVALGLGLTFLNGFAYQGLTGSFEDTRHLWLLLGLLIAASRLPFNPPGESNRRVAEPSPC
jgi:O-antigen ligase